MGIRMVIETHPGGRLSTHASRRHILGFREGYARRCDYDYRPRFGLNMGGGMDDEQRRYNMNIKKIGQVPDRKKSGKTQRRGPGAQHYIGYPKQHASSKKTRNEMNKQIGK